MIELKSGNHDFFAFLRPRPAKEVAVDLNQVRALLKYASEEVGNRELDDGDNPDLSALLKTLLTKVNQVDDDEAIPKDLEPEILQLYSKLCHHTEGVTGKTIVDGREYVKTTRWLRRWTMLFALFAVASAGLGGWLNDQVPPDPLTLWSLWALHFYFFSIVEPFLWGALGTCIYLLKRVTDLRQNFQFDRDHFPGWMSRILLGSVLGGGLAYLFEAEALIEGDLGPNALAFITGLMTKIIYGAVEKFTEAVATKFGMGRVRASDKMSDPVHDYITRALADIDPTRDKHTYNALVGLLKKRAGHESG